MVAASAVDVRPQAPILHPAIATPQAQKETVDTYQAPRPRVNRQGATEPAKYNFGESAANAVTWGFFGSMGNALFRCCWPF